MHTTITRYCATCGQTAEAQSAHKYVCHDGHENWVDPVPGTTLYILNPEGDAVLYGVRSIGENAGKLNVPSGYVDMGETAEQAAYREAREEMGVEIELLDILGTYTSGRGNQWVLNVVFVARITSGIPMPGDDLSGGEARWIGADALPGRDELAWPWQYAAQQDLQHWLSRQPVAVQKML
ncbi:NUDIX hydrolase [Candidatus Saccharibacteria bacterium]|nr:NUDIX hydrolase [Candidatus Saccharibacteria bacterium]